MAENWRNREIGYLDLIVGDSIAGEEESDFRRRRKSDRMIGCARSTRTLLRLFFFDLMLWLPLTTKVILLTSDLDRSSLQHL